MDFRSLTYFMTVAKELNFTKAAEKLNMSQPPLSNQIKNLEEDLGVELFIRSKRGLTLTDAGALLMRRAAQVLELADKTRGELDSMNQGLSGTLFLGMVEGRAPFLAAQMIAGFREEFPMVKYELWNGSSDDVLDQLYHGIADLAVICAPYDYEKLDGITVGREPWVAIMSEDHPLAKKDGTEIELEDLVGQDLIVPRRKSRVDAIRKWFGTVHAEPNILCEQSNYIDAVAMAKANVGISLFPQTLDEDLTGVVSKTIVNPAKTAKYVLVWNREQPLNEIAEAFLDYVSDMVENGELEIPERTEHAESL